MTLHELDGGPLTTSKHRKGEKEKLGGAAGRGVTTSTTLRSENRSNRPTEDTASSKPPYVKRRRSKGKMVQ